MSKIKVKDLSLWYGDFQALKGVNGLFQENRITAIIGPSGCGKSTLLRAFNRMNELIEGVRTEGEILIDNANIIAPGIDLVALRKKVGMVFQRPNPFPLSIYENIVFGERIHAESIKKERLDEIVEKSLRSVLLWEGLKDKLHKPALSLSLEQKQRLCIARLIAVRPDILLMDEPCSALDPQATQRIEELMRELKNINPDFKLVVAGGGPEEVVLRKMAAEYELTDKVFLLGSISQDELAIYYQAASIFVLNSGYEGLSHVVLDAMHYRLPIIASNIGGNPELIQDDYNGLLVEYNDYDAWLKAVDRLWRDHKLRERLASSPLVKLDIFNFNKMVAETMRIINSF